MGFINVTEDTLAKYKVETSAVSNHVNDFYFIKELICWMFVVYDAKNAIYKVNIRSRGPVINEIASNFNGGGHKFASGARISNYKDVEALHKELDKACLDYLKMQEK